MGIGVKLGVAASALLLLAACESKTGGEGDNNGANVGAATPGSDQEFQQNVGDRVFFDYDSSVLSSEAQATLDKQAAWLAQYNTVNIVVEGHCDERGTREYNLALGERRANAARNYLVSKGVDAKRVSTVSYGKERPAVVGSGEESYSKNRRSVTVLAR